MPRHLAKTAQLIQTLVFYDGPQLALFRTDRDTKLLALAVGNPGAQNIFFACEVADKAFRAYMNGRVDLNFIYRYSSGRRLYFFDWSMMTADRSITLRPALQAEMVNQKLYPDRGFFEVDHTEEWTIHTTPGVRTNFNIDGKWDAEDFSKFYTKIGDIYAFLSFVEDLGSTTIGAEERDNIKSALTDTSWRGGGSYVGFYSDIATHAREVRPLKVTGIEYHSPGHIEVEGRASVFSEIYELLLSFENNEAEIKDIYGNLNSVLDHEGLKRSNKEKEFSNVKIKDYVKEKTIELSSGLNVEDPEVILTVCDDNVVVFCKVILSYYRRVRDFYAFRREGRLTFTGEHAANTLSAPQTGRA